MAGTSATASRSCSREEKSAIALRAPGVLGVHGGEIGHLRLLGAVRRLGTAVDAEIAHLLAAEGAAGEHALDGLLDHALGELALEDLAGGAVLDAAREAGMPVVALVGPLVAGQLHLLG